MGTRRKTRVKTTRSHSSAINTVETLLKTLNRCSAVSKVSLGVIKPGATSGSVRLKATVLNSKVLLIQARGVSAVQDVRVYACDHSIVKKAVEDLCKKKRWPLNYEEPAE